MCDFCGETIDEPRTTIMIPTTLVDEIGEIGVTFFDNLVEDLLCCYMKYLIDKKYHSYWNILFFTGLFYFIIIGIYFIIILWKLTFWKIIY